MNARTIWSQCPGFAVGGGSGGGVFLSLSQKNRGQK